MRLVRMTTVPISLHKLLAGQPEYFTNKGFEVSLISANGKEIELIEKQTGIKVKIIPLTRKITPYQDLMCLWNTLKFFRELKPDIVHTHTPKAGLIGMLAAKLAGVPIRIHTIAGLPLMETKGLKRKVLNFVERTTSWSATNVYPNSYIQKDFMEINGLCHKAKLRVIGDGSSNGIDTTYFNKIEVLDSVSKMDYFNENDIIFSFVGRIVKDKGINELVAVFDRLSKEFNNVYLLLVGEEERELDSISESSIEIIANNKQIVSLGWQKDVRPFLAMSDVFVFPSYREGFPNVVMQAGAMELPCIVTDINGSNEIIEEGVNGLIIPVKDEVVLYEKMILLIKEPQLLAKLAKPARQMIIDRFEQKIIWIKLLNEYIELLDKKKIVHQIKKE